MNREMIAKSEDLLGRLRDCDDVKTFLDVVATTEVDRIDQTEVRVDSIEFSVTYNRHGRPTVDIDSIEVDIPDSAVEFTVKGGDDEDHDAVVEGQLFDELKDFLEALSKQSAEEEKYEKKYKRLRTAILDVIAAVNEIDDNVGE